MKDGLRLLLAIKKPAIVELMAPVLMEFVVVSLAILENTAKSKNVQRTAITKEFAKTDNVDVIKAGLDQIAQLAMFSTEILSMEKLFVETVGPVSNATNLNVSLIVTEMENVLKESAYVMKASWANIAKNDHARITAVITESALMVYVVASKATNKRIAS